MIDQHTYVKRNNDVFANEIDGEVVMMNIQTGKYYGLDEVGSRIWEMMEYKIQVKNIIEQLQMEYDVSEKQCKTDVLNLLNDLKSNQLIEIS